MKLGLEGQVILVTGAAGAMGSAVMRKVEEKGAYVVAVDRKPLGLGDTERRAVVVGDVSRSYHWQKIEESVVERFGRLTGLVTSAAILDPLDRGVDPLNLEVWTKTIGTNLTGALLASRLAVKLMSVGGGGSVVHIGSTVAHLGSAVPQLGYTAAKGGVVALARELAIAYCDRGIRVNVVSPGLVKSALSDKLVANDAALQQRLSHVPMRRLGQPEEVAEAVVWLLSDAASYITGTELFVDGGMTAAFLTGNE